LPSGRIAEGEPSIVEEGDNNPSSGGLDPDPPPERGVVTIPSKFSALSGSPESGGQAIEKSENASDKACEEHNERDREEETEYFLGGSNSPLQASKRGRAPGKMSERPPNIIASARHSSTSMFQSEENSSSAPCRAGNPELRREALALNMWK